MGTRTIVDLRTYSNDTPSSWLVVICETKLGQPH